MTVVQKSCNNIVTNITSHILIKMQTMIHFCLERQEFSPRCLHQSTESIIVLQGSPPIGGDLHTIRRMSKGWRTKRYKGWLVGILSSNNTIAELLCYWNFVEAWTCSNHGNAWNNHFVKGFATDVHEFVVIVLEGSDGVGNNLTLRATAVEARPVLNHQEDHGVEMDKTDIGFCYLVVAADGKRNVVASAKDSSKFIKTHYLKDTFCKIMPGACARREVQVDEEPVGFLGESGCTTGIGGGKEVWIKVVN
jgi:hypothetical protein